MTVRHLVTNQHLHTFGSDTVQGTILLIGHGGPNDRYRAEKPDPVGPFVRRCRARRLVSRSAARATIT